MVNDLHQVLSFCKGLSGYKYTSGHTGNVQVLRVVSLLTRVLTVVPPSHELAVEKASGSE